MSEWFYGKHGQQYGPMDEATLRARAATGEVGPDDLVWCEGMEGWKPLREIFDFGGPPPLAAASPGESATPPPGSASPYAPPAASSEGAQSQPAPALPTTNGPAIASLVCGILSLVFFCLCGGIFFGIPAVICGHLALSQLNSPANQQEGRGLAIAGLICGYCGMAIFVLMMLQGDVTLRYNDDLR